MPSIAPLAEVSSNVDTVAKFVRVIAREGVTMEQLNLPVNNRVARYNLAAFLAAGCPKITSPNEEGVYDLAIKVLGVDFVMPEEVVKARLGIIYTYWQIRFLAETIPSAENLQWCKDNGCAVMPAPPSDLSLLEVRDVREDYFSSKKDGWYTKDSEEFSRKDKISFGWLAIRKTPVSKSTNKNWDDQNRLLSALEHVPNAATMAWFITTYFGVRGIRLFERICVRTSSCDSKSNRVDIGFGRDGLNISASPGDFKFIGLSSARKF